MTHRNLLKIKDPNKSNTQKYFRHFNVKRYELALLRSGYFFYFGRLDYFTCMLADWNALLQFYQVFQSKLDKLCESSSDQMHHSDLWPPWSPTCDTPRFQGVLTGKIFRFWWFRTFKNCRSDATWSLLRWTWSLLSRLLNDLEEYLEKMEDPIYDSRQYETQNV